MTNQAPASHLVVVGASAGGIEALSTLVSSLPSDFPAPIVIAQHLDPRRPSRLEEILARRTPLLVRTVVDHEVLRAGVVFVVPADRHVEITDHAMSLRPGTPGSKPSVDRLFSSAASAFGEQLIAIVLSGTGSDGSLGARVVHEAGGTVIIQNPATAHFPGMPRSLAPSTVDVVADLEDIGTLLQAIVAGTYTPAQPGDERELRALLADLRERRGVDFSSYRRSTILRRLQRRMGATSFDALAGYRRFLLENPDEEERLVSSLLIKVTDFFRDPKLFTYLRERTLPALINAARARGGELRFWSAGCATGEEAYSIAILVSEVLGAEPSGIPVRVFATDLDGSAISFARRGVYPAKSLASLPPELVARYFTEVDGEYEVSKALRDLIVFGEHALGQRPPFPQTDLVLCRNVLMYFMPELQKRTLEAFAFSLREGGSLVLGSGESARPAGALFTAEESALRIYRRTAQRAPFPLQRLENGALRLPTPAPLQLPAAEGPQMVERARALSSGGGRDELLIELPVGVIEIDRRYDIQVINLAARRLLGIHSLAVGEDLIHLLDSMAVPALRGAIDAAFRSEAPISLEEVATAELGMGEERYLQITCLPQYARSDDGSVASVMVTVIDVTAIVHKRQVVEQAYEAQHEEMERLRGLMEKLGETNRKLLASNEVLARAEEVLRTTNEEHLAADAQAQSANEELETYAEELQSTNEEMETLNEELKATIEELSLSNEDLDARSQELAAQRAASEEGAAQMAAILASMGDAVVVVNAAGSPLRTNAAYDALLANTDGPFIPHDEQGQPLPAEVTPEARAARGESFSLQFVVPAADGSRRWFEANGQPLRSHAEGAERGVIVIREVTERSLRRLQEQFVGLAGHELRTPLTVLQGYLQLHLREIPAGAGSERLRQSATDALDQVRRLNALVEDLLDVTRLQSGVLQVHLEPMDLVSVALQAVDTARAVAQGQAIELDVGAEPFVVSGDAGRLEEVLLNLLNNAIKYAPGTKSIEVRLRRVDGEAELAVQDYGPGMPADELPNIFTRFYQVVPTDHASHSGLGLGLFISRAIVTAHGGRIEVQSAAGRGTTFTVRLPLIEGTTETV